MQDKLYLDQHGKDLSFIEYNPKIELVKDTGVNPPDADTMKNLLWVAYGMITVKNVFKHPSYGPRDGCDCRDDIRIILSMAREVEFDKVN